MAIQRSMQKVRVLWIERVSRELAHGEGVRAGFAEQLERFYDLLEQAVVTGDTAWLEPLLFAWGRSSTETNLESGDYDVSFVMNRIVTLTIEVIRENLGIRDAMEAISENLNRLVEEFCEPVNGKKQGEEGDNNVG